MTRNKNVNDTKSFIEKASNVHGCKYDYTKTTYTKNTEKVTITCPVHGDLYDYSEVEYASSHTNVKIHCMEHGMFEQTPTDHLSGKGCRECGTIRRANKKRISFETFVDRSNKAHDNRYIYHSNNFKAASNKVGIICPEHGMFHQTGYKHLAGQGCPECAKKKYGTNPNSAYGLVGYYGTDSIAYIYIFKIGENCIKLGIAKDFELRRRQIEKCVQQPTEILKTFRGGAREIFKIEQELLSKYKEYRYDFGFQFHGHTECLDIACVEHLLKDIEECLDNQSEDCYS